MEEKSPGILLHSFSYLSKGSILKVFTKQSGLVSLFAKGSRVYRPFCIGEWVYQKKNQDLFSLKDFSFTHPLTELQCSFEHLKAGGMIAQDLLLSQLPEEKAPLLYSLTEKYLLHMIKAKFPKTLALSFLCKRRYFEGTFYPTPHCALCPKAAATFFQGQSLCTAHAAIQTPILPVSTWNLLFLLTFSKKFSIILDLDASDEDLIKIKHIIDPS